MSEFRWPQLHELLVVGAGGSGREVAWLAREIHGEALQITFAVEPRWLSAATVDDIPVVPLERSECAKIRNFVVAVGDLNERRRLAETCESFGMSPAALVHPSAIHSSRVTFGEGSIVCAGAIITTNVQIGRHVHINIGCSISHDVVLGDFATLSPGVRLAGHVHVEHDVFLGTGATVINGTAGRPLVLGHGAIVAAGACVTHTVPSGALVAGVPAVIKRTRSDCNV